MNNLLEHCGVIMQGWFCLHASVSVIQFFDVFHHDGTAFYKLSKQSSKQIHQGLIVIFIAAVDIADTNISGVKALLQVVDDEEARDIRILAT